MSDPINLRVHRPYGSVDEFLAAEAWTMDAKSVLLLEQEELPTGTVVRFEIVLDNGEKPIRAEGTVHKAVAARGKRPAGLKIRLKRIGAATKATIERAVTLRKSRNSLAPKRSKRPPAAEPPVAQGDVTETETADAETAPEPAGAPEPDAETAPEPAGAPEPDAETAPEPESAPEPDAGPEQGAAPEPDTAPVDAPSAARGESQVPSSERSGVRHRRIVPPPADRDALLERLRTRASRLAKPPASGEPEKPLTREDTG